MDYRPNSDWLGSENNEKLFKHSPSDLSYTNFGNGHVTGPGEGERDPGGMIKPWLQRIQTIDIEKDSQAGS